MKHSFDRTLVCGVLSPLISGIATVCLAVATRHISPYLAAGLGPIIGAMFLCAINRQARTGLLTAEVYQHRWTVLRLVLFRGLLGAVLFTVGLSMTNAAKAVFFTKIEPYFVLAWGWILFKERVALDEIVLLLVHVAGALLLAAPGASSGGNTSMTGDLLIVASMAASGLSYFDAKRLSVALGARRATVVTSFASGVAILLAALPSGVLLRNEWNATAAGFFLLHVILFHVVALTLWYVALQGLKGWAVSALRALGPLAGLPAAYLLLGETLSAWQLAGGAMVLVTSASIGKVQQRVRMASKAVEPTPSPAE